MPCPKSHETLRYTGSSLKVEDNNLPAASASIALITVSYGSESVLPRFLASISGASSRSMLVVVADNDPSSKPGTAELVDQAGYVYVPMLANLGYGGAVNAVAARLPPQIEWIVIANPDVSITPGAVDILLARGRGDPKIGLLGPQITDEAGTIYPSARSIPSLRLGIGHALFANVWPKNPWSAAYHNDQFDEQRSRDAGWLSGAFLLARRSAFDSVAGFDTRYFMYFEDVDLGYRMAKAGWSNVFEPAAQVVHSGAHSTTSNSQVMIREHHSSARKFLKTKYSAWYLFPVRLIVSFGLGVRLRVVQLRSGQASSPRH